MLASTKVDPKVVAAVVAVRFLSTQLRTRTVKVTTYSNVTTGTGSPDFLDGTGILGR